jgi:hypothetical protein
MLTLDKLYKVPTEIGVIPPEAFKECARWIESYDDIAANVLRNRMNGNWKLWLSNEGSWPKRFAKFYYTDWAGRNINPNLLSILGEKIKRYHLSTNYSFFELSNKINWKAGDFGDNMSCWFTPYYAKEPMTSIFMEAGGIAIKFYESEAKYTENPNKGIGRCWGWLMDENFYIFNTKGELTIGQAALIISKGLDMKYSSLDLQLNGSYVDTKPSYVIGNWKKLPLSYSMNWFKEYMERKKADGN